MASPHDSRILQAVDLLKAEAAELEQHFNRSYPRMVQEARFSGLLTLSNRIALLKHTATQLEAI